jgi:uncharacterized protein YifN (PemK superfamily)
MVKQRPVVVVSPKRMNRILCVVVPLSTVPPVRVLDCHHPIPAGRYPALPPEKDSWVKGDMLYTVAMERLSLLGNASLRLSEDDFAALKRCLRYTLDMD